MVLAPPRLLSRSLALIVRVKNASSSLASCLNAPENVLRL